MNRYASDPLCLMAETMHLQQAEPPLIDVERELTDQGIEYLNEYLDRKHPACDDRELVRHDALVIAGWETPDTDGRPHLPGPYLDWRKQDIELFDHDAVAPHWYKFVDWMSRVYVEFENVENVDLVALRSLLATLTNPEVAAGGWTDIPDPLGILRGLLDALEAHQNR